jgi:hypothetical protein
VTKKEEAEKLRAQLVAERSSFDAHWRELAQHYKPRGVIFSSSELNRGDKRSQKIIDTTPVFALRTMTAGMQSGITSPARPWMRLTTPDPDLAEQSDVKDWLHVVTQRMGSVFAKSNLYKALPRLYESMGAFGTGAMSVEEDDHTVVNFRNFPLGQYYIANDHRDQVRTFVRCFPMTVRQLLGQFGQRNASGQITNWGDFSQRVKDAHTNKRSEEKVEVVQVIQTNEDYNPDRLHAKYKAYASCYYEAGGESTRVLEESGYDEFPVLVGRWDVTAGDIYATDCPGMTALSDVKQLQYGEKMAAEAITKMVRPPMIGPEKLRGQVASILSGGMTYLDEDNGQKFRPAIEVDFRTSELENKQGQIRSRIDRAFYVDLFLLMSQSDRKQITATEIMERKEEKLLALGPMLEGLNQDVLDPLIDRTFNIMLRRGLIPDAPESLQGTPLKVEYISIMAQAQKSLGRSGLEAFTGFYSTIAKVDPSILDKIDQDQLVDEYADMTGIPPRIIVPDEDVAKIRAQRAQQQQAMQQAELMKTAGAGAKDLSESDTQGPNALTALVGKASAPTQQAAA